MKLSHKYKEFFFIFKLKVTTMINTDIILLPLLSNIYVTSSMFGDVVYLESVKCVKRCFYSLLNIQDTSTFHLVWSVKYICSVNPKKNVILAVTMMQIVVLVCLL